MKKFLILIVIILTACTRHSKTEKDLHNVLNSQLKIEILKNFQHMDSFISMQQLRQNYPHLSIVFLQEGCQPCYPKFVDWHKKMKELEQVKGHTIIFIIQTNEYENFIGKVKRLGEEINDRYYIFIDKEGKFLDANKDIPRWVIDASVLIDSENKIKMVGAPFATPEMTDLFYEICAK